MHRQQVDNLVNNLPGGDMIAAISFLSFLCGSKPSDRLQSAVERLYVGDYDGYFENAGGIDPWEADEQEARRHLRSLIASVREGDLYTVRRFLEYLAEGSGPALPTTANSSPEHAIRA